MERTFKYKIDRTKLKDSLRHLGLTQVQFSHEVGLTPSYILGRTNKFNNRSVRSDIMKRIRDKFTEYKIDADKLGLFYEVPKAINKK